MINMQAYFNKSEQPEISRLFCKHRPTFVKRLLIEEDRSSPDNPNINFHRVSLSDIGRALLDDAGFVAEQEKLNQDLQDKLTAQKALIDTARWQAKGVILNTVLGVVTILITVLSAYMTFIDDKDEREKQDARISVLEKKLFNMAIPRKVVPVINKTTSKLSLPKQKVDSLLIRELVCNKGHLFFIEECFHGFRIVF